MLFNSLEFGVFLPIVFFLYWFVFKSNLKSQNLLLLCASYFFYGWWDYRFLGLIAFSSLVDFLVGIQIDKLQNLSKKKYLLTLSLIVNLGFLGLFKYYNFFLDSFVDAFSLFGKDIDPNRLNIILPVGISFYTFQTLSYTIDIFREKIKPTKDLISFLAFVSFFPQLVAGPIERASNLLPQFFRERRFSYNNATDGLRQILWGLFKKVVIADNCAAFVNIIFEDPTSFSGSTLFIAAIFFAFQIYGDFSGYSDIAIGTARLFGFRLMKNFSFPYFSRDIAEFWRRWHISLSTWFRDYVYIPLGGSRGGISTKIRNVFVIFLVSGFWHGANWTYILWGLLNALYFLPLLLFNKNRSNIDNIAMGRFFPNIKEIFQISTTFSLTVIAWIFFRAESVWVAFDYHYHMFSDFLSYPSKSPANSILILLFSFVIIEWVQRNKNHGLEIININIYYRWIIYLLVVLVIYFYGGTQQQFIYFQF